MSPAAPRQAASRPAAPRPAALRTASAAAPVSAPRASGPAAPRAPRTPIGSYIPGESVLHATDARVKMLVLLAYIVALFTAGSFTGLIACLVLLVGGYFVAHLPLSLLLRGCKTLAIVLVFVILANALTFSATTDPVMSFVGLRGGSIPLIGSFGLRPLGALRGLFFSLRILALVSAVSLLCYTTPLVSLTNALVWLLCPLRALHVPVDDVATVFSIALRFIPICAAEADRIRLAQTARGARFDSGGPLTRIKAWTPVLVPLFVQLFRRADQLAAGMESRCYTGHGRTSLRASETKPLQVAVGILLAAAIVALGIIL